MVRKRTSPVWNVSKDELEKVVKQSQSIASIIRYFNFVPAGSAYKMIKQRCEEDDISMSHIPMGLGSNNGKTFSNRKKIPLEDILIKNSTYNRGHLKRRLLKNGMLRNECYTCGQQPEWNSEKMVMVIDHINGDRCDHRLENLRMLCPNCNSQTKTFSGKNIKHDKKKYYCKCGKKITKWSKGQCVLCSREDVNKRKVKNRPSIEILLKEVKEFGFCGTGRKYGVSDNAVRKWLK